MVLYITRYVDIATYLYFVWSYNWQYALNNVLAYEGQIVAVKNNGKQEVYVLDSTLEDGLRNLANGNSGDYVSKSATENILSGDLAIDKHDLNILSGNFV